MIKKYRRTHPDTEQSQKVDMITQEFESDLSIFDKDHDQHFDHTKNFLEDQIFGDLLDVGQVHLNHLIDLFVKIERIILSTYGYEED